MAYLVSYGSLGMRSIFEIPQWTVPIFHESLMVALHGCYLDSSSRLQ
jgi:hypothetical protein